MGGFNQKIRGGRGAKRGTFVSLAAAAVIFSSYPDSGEAFGPVCIPVMANCFCTFAVPCPVLDVSRKVELALKNADLKKMITLAREIKDPQAMIVKLATGKLPFSSIGLDAIGVDFSGFATGDLSSIASGLGMPQAVIDVASNASSLGIDTGMVSRLVSGDLRPEDFLSVAINAGMDLSGLEAVGLGKSQILAIASGKVDPASLVGAFANGPLAGEIISGLGIDQKLLSDIAKGKVDPSALLNVAYSLGLDQSMLDSVGLDSAMISSIARGDFKPADIVKLAQNAGIDDSVFSELGIDASILSDVMSGTIASDQATAALSAVGITPGSIVTPGPGGSAASMVSLGDSLRDYIDYGRLVAFPVDSIPGLAEAAGLASKSLDAPGMSGSSVCTPGGGQLVTVIDPDEPHMFPATMPELDLLMSSGGDMSLFEESSSEAYSLATNAIAGGFARAAFQKESIKLATPLFDNYQKMVNDAETAKDDFVANSMVKMQNMVAASEIASLMTVWTTLSAADTLIKDRPLDLYPLLPQGETYARKIQQVSMSVGEAKKSAMRQTSIDHTEIIKSAKMVVDLHNVAVGVAGMQATVPPLLETIQTHETIKSQRKRIEDWVRDAANKLYLDGADAYERILPVLVSGSGSYFDEDKWASSSVRADALSAEIMAQSPKTRFGTRRPNPCYSYVRDEGNSECDPFVTISNTAGFPDIASWHSGRGDPIKVVSIRPRYDEETPDTISPPIQFYFAVTRRAVFWGDLRHGEGRSAMPSYVWDEFRFNDPSCLSGPYPSTPEMFSARPDMFDVSASCSHMVWAGGDAEDFIRPSEFGGTDAALWSVKMAAALADMRGATPEKVRAAAQSVQSAIVSARTGDRMAAAGMSSGSDQIAVLTSLMGRVGASDYSAVIDFPFP